MHKRLDAVEEARRGVGRDANPAALEIELIGLLFKRLLVLVCRLADLDRSRPNRKLDGFASTARREHHPVAAREVLFQCLDCRVVRLHAPAKLQPPPAAQFKIRALPLHPLRLREHGVTSRRKR